MNQIDDTGDGQQLRATVWRILRRLAVLAVLAVAAEWGIPLSTDVLLSPTGCATNVRDYEVRDTTPHAPSGGRGRTSSTSCTSR
jgi:hypothetical protein